MSDTTLTPDQIKSIAAEIRRTENDKLGTKLPNTTTLNAITRSLGLGADFRAFKSSFEAKNAPVVPSVTMSNLIFVIENDQLEELPCSPEVQAGIGAIIEDAGFCWEITEGAHNFSLLTAFSTGNKHSVSDILALKERLSAHLEKLAEAYEIGKINGAIHWQSVEPDRKLIVNFRYYDNDQVCSATVSESAWKARSMLNNEELAFLVLYSDNEIENTYTVNDIAVEDVMVNITFWQDE